MIKNKDINANVKPIETKNAKKNSTSNEQNEKYIPSFPFVKEENNFLV